MDIIKIDIDENFWDCNPQFKYFTEYQELYKKDKSAKKEKSSKLVWAAMLFCDSLRSQFYLLPEQARKEEIMLNYLGVNADWEQVLQLTGLWIKYSMNPLEKQLHTIVEKLVEREELIKNTKYTLDNAPTLDKLQMDTPKLIDTITIIKQKLQTDEQQGVIKGGGTETFDEKGEL